MRSDNSRPVTAATDRGRNVLLLGQARWTREVADGLRSHTELAVDAMPIDSVGDALQMLSARRFKRADVIVRVGFRPGARTIRGFVFDTIFNAMHTLSGAPVVYYWLGTDAANAVRDASSGNESRRFRKMAQAATHLADSESVREELASLGLEATTVWLPAPNAPQQGEVVAPPARFTVLSYVPDARPEFYGGPSLAQAAAGLPEVLVRVVGGTGTWLADRPENLEFLGWREDMGALYDESSVLVRMLEHDSVSCMVVEALAHGRPVVYSSPFPNTIQVEYNDVDGLEQALRKLVRAGESESPLISAETVAWARKLADPSACYSSIADELLRVSRTRSS